MAVQRAIFGMLYRRHRDVTSLPWHREEPPALLDAAIADRVRPGRALDLGCGQGVNAVHLARRGWDVVGIDFVPAAVEAARDRAARAGVALDLRVGDVLDHRPGEPYDLVLDSGCLHHLPKRRVPEYRSRLDEWLAPGGHYVLVHFAHRPKALWVPNGPRHLRRADAIDLLAPLELRADDETTYDVPLPMGRMRAGVYWFTRPTEGGWTAGGLSARR